MRRIEIKVTLEDRKVHFNALEHYINYVSNLMVMENKGILHMQYSILWCMHHELVKFFNKRSQPESSTLKLDPHDAHSLRDALLYLNNTSNIDIEKAQASRLFEQIDKQLHHEDRDKLIIN